MAAKKKTKPIAKAAEETNPAKKPAGARGQAADSPAAQADVAPAEGIVPPRPGPPVAGIGASAGGLDAFKRFFAAMPADSGVAFVLIPHLDPTHESLMVELISRDTRMPVVEATDGMAVVANSVYVIPPNKYMTISGGVLRLTGPVERGGPHTSIDLFLRSLANDKREKAVCIILSGTGSHGSLGLKAVKSTDGMAMVQDPNTAEYPRMPQSAIATGLVDFVLPVERMPEALIKYVQHDYVQGTTAGAEGTEGSDDLNQILALLRAGTNFDFRCYRKRMLMRRIERRMGLGHFDQLADYRAFLREHPNEVKQLFRDLLISVTNFFRDPEAFQALETEVIAALVRGKAPDATIRVWSAGCATGEEPYSLGIALLEHLAAAQKSCRVHIFAADVDEGALEVARKGIYLESIATDVCAERLARFFTRVDETSYQVNKSLREIVIFARQNLITDAPFSKLDLIVCRNLLIYLEPEVQKKVLSLLHYSLNEGGFLFLGPSETIGRHIELFEPVSKKWRIFRRIGPSRPEHVELPITALSDPLVRARRLAPPSTTPPVSFAGMTHRLLLEQFAPAAVLVDRNYEILYFFGPTDRYLAVVAGEPTQDLMLMAREGLRTRLRPAIHKAVRESGPVTLAAQVKRNGDYHPVIVTIRPVRGPQGAETLMLVTFEDSDQERVLPHPAETAAEESAVRQLEYELKAAKEDLQSTIEDLESSNEELKISNEEVMSMNEELQSANEELETSKEELQSLNEELTTVNNQLEEKVRELESANDDMANLFDCTEVAIIFLDDQFRIKRYTPPATRLFNLIATDLDRPISDITPKFPDGGFQQDVERALRTLSPQEKQVQTSDGCWWNLRITLYRTLADRIEGVVLTFTDVTRSRQADEQARWLAAVLLDSNDAVIVHDFDGKISAWNHGAEQMFGYSQAEALKMNAQQMIPEEWLAKVRAYWERLRQGERVDSWEAQRRTKAGRILDIWATATVLKDESGRPVSIAKTERDITEHKRTETAMRDSEERFRLLFENSRDAIVVADDDGNYLLANSAACELLGYPRDQLMRMNVSDLVTVAPPDAAARYAAYVQAGSGAGMFHFLRSGRSGAERIAEYAASQFAPGQHISILRDVTEREQSRQMLLQREQEFRALVENDPDVVARIDRHFRHLYINPAIEGFTGLPRSQFLGKTNRELGMPERLCAEWERHLEQVFETGQEQRIEFAFDSPDKVLHFQSRLVPEFGPVEQVQTVLVIARDMTERKLLERQVFDIADEERRLIGEELHDSVGQELTALNMLASDLAEIVRVDPVSSSKLVERIVEGVDRSQKDLRAVLQGLLPVAVDVEGLMAALSDLAERTQGEGEALCTFDCTKPVSVADNHTATQLYLIAQEAVHNAVKHAQPRNIRISLEATDVLLLSVQDDGTGMPAQPAETHDGLGLRIMRNRAAIIGATLTIEPAKPTGTLVTCAVARKT